MTGSSDTKGEIARLREELEGGVLGSVLQGGPSASSPPPAPRTPAEIARLTASEVLAAVGLVILAYLGTALLALAGPFIAMAVFAASVWAGAGFLVAAVVGVLIGGGGVMGAIFVSVLAIMILAVPAGIVAVATKVPFVVVAWTISLAGAWTPPAMEFVMTHSVR